MKNLCSQIRHLLDKDHTHHQVFELSGQFRSRSSLNKPKHSKLRCNFFSKFRKKNQSSCDSKAEAINKKSSGVFKKNPLFANNNPYLNDELSETCSSPHSVDMQANQLSLIELNALIAAGFESDIYALMHSAAPSNHCLAHSFSVDSRIRAQCISSEFGSQVLSGHTSEEDDIASLDYENTSIRSGVVASCFSSLSEISSDADMAPDTPEYTWTQDQLRVGDLKLHEIDETQDLRSDLSCKLLNKKYPKRDARLDARYAYGNLILLFPHAS